MPLSDSQLRRYARHIVLPEIGEARQARLLASSALVIGAGGLGSSAILYMAAAGVGRIGIVEPDRVELSNLQRQIVFEEADIGRPKADAARDRVYEINPDCRVEIYPVKLSEHNASILVAQYDVVLDGSDNFPTRFAVNAACIEHEKPLISAAISGFSAQLSTFKPFLGAPNPCYRCLVPEAPQREVTCAQEGVLGPLAGMMGSMQAMEAIKELLIMGESLSGRLLVVDALTLRIKELVLARDMQCPHCHR